MPSIMDAQTKIVVVPLMAHQKRNILTATLYPAWGFFDDTGTGKTRIGIEIIKHHGVKTLIVCPKSNMQSVWVEEIAKWAPELSKGTANLWNLWQKRLPKERIRYEMILRGCDVAIINYEGFKNQLPQIRLAGFDMLILDESSKLRNPQAQVTKAMITYSDTVKYRYLFSGTPAPNTKQEYWSQVRIIDHNIFGNNFWAFRDRYFKQHPFIKFKWTFKKFDADKGLDLEKEFFDKLKSISSHVNKKDVLDIPEQTFNIRLVELDKEEQRAYDEMKHTLVAEFENKEVVAANQAVKIMKLREITSGFLLRQDIVVNPHRPEVISFGTSKLDELKELLEEIGDHQVIITVQFNHEAEQIEKLFWDTEGGKFAEKKYGIINGSKSYSERENSRIGFQQGDIQYLIAHTKSLATGHNLQNCHYLISYSIDYSYENQKQVQDRIHRQGQVNPCSYYYLLAKGTIDEVIYRSLQGKKDTLQAVLNYISRDKKKQENDTLSILTAGVAR